MATAQLPALLYERLDEFGIDVSFVYPTSLSMYISQPELRRPYIRAFNLMTAELFAPFRDRLIPVAVLPSHTPAGIDRRGRIRDARSRFQGRSHER